MWLVHHEGDQIIRIWGSFKNGKERIYLNDEIISEKRNFRKNSEFNFKDSKGSEYFIRGNTNPANKKMECFISKNSQPIKTFHINFSRPKVTKKVMARLTLLLPIALTYGILKGNYDLPSWTFVLFILFVFLYTILSFEKAKITITETLHS